MKGDICIRCIIYGAEGERERDDITLRSFRSLVPSRKPNRKDLQNDTFFFSSTTTRQSLSLSCRATREMGKESYRNKIGINKVDFFSLVILISFYKSKDIKNG